VDPVIVSDVEIRAAVPMRDAIDAVRDGFRRLARGEFEMPTRTALGDGQFLVMSAHHIPTGTAMVKTLSLNFAGTRQPAIVGTITWSDLVRADQLIADAAAVTALRTGAASGVATDLLAAPDASNLVMIGAGAQAADQVRAVHAVRPITDVTIVARSGERAEQLAAALRTELDGVDVGVDLDISTAVGSADIVCCATTATEPLFSIGALKTDVHVNAIGSFRPSMRELSDELLTDCGTVFIDQHDAILEESGEILHALSTGAITTTALVEIGTALLSGPPGVERPRRTVFKSVGVAMQDWAIADLLASRLLT
jgi:ornithine cyclodeaminase